jgi:transposase
MLLEFPTAGSIADAHLTRLTNVLHDNSKGQYGRDKAVLIKESAAKSIGLNSRAAGFELQQTIRLIQHVQTEIDAVDAEIRKAMDEIGSPIMSVPGIGYVLGAIILSEIGNIENFSNPAKLLSFAGLEPSVSESGEYVAGNTPMVKRGSKYLRWALMQAARLAAYRDAAFHAYSEKKLSEGKHYFVVQSHVAKKLVRVIHHLLKNNQQYEPQAA